VEQAERAQIVANDGIRVERAYEKYGWVILSVSAVFGIMAAVMTTLPPLSWFTDPVIIMTYSLMGALGVTWVGFNLFALILTLIPFRRGERWAWVTLWMLPLMWLSQFVLAPDLSYYLVLAIISTVGLILPYRRFFSRAEKEELV
jgi:hypothetical protein